MLHAVHAGDATLPCIMSFAGRRPQWVHRTAHGWCSRCMAYTIVAPKTQRRADHTKWRDANGVSTTVLIGMNCEILNGTATMSPPGIGLTSHASAVTTVDTNAIRNQLCGGNIIAMITNIGAYNHIYKTQVRRRISANRLCATSLARPTNPATNRDGL